jgi:hypothetical protein
VELSTEYRHPAAAVLDLLRDRRRVGLELVEVGTDHRVTVGAGECVAAAASGRGEHGRAAAP